MDLSHITIEAINTNEAEHFVCQENSKAISFYLICSDIFFTIHFEGISIFMMAEINQTTNI